MIIRTFLPHLLRRAEQAGSAVVRGIITLTSLTLLFLALGLTLASAATATPRVLVVGDSISAAYGMNLEQGWVALLAARLQQRDPESTVINASISGDTTAGGLRRLPSLLEKHAPNLVLIELGGNDGLRGYPIKQLRQNLTRMTELAQDADARVLLLAMEVPPNLGGRYTSAFRDSFPKIADATGASASPFILEGVATNPQLMQRDRIHPTVAAQPLILDNVWPYIMPLVDQVAMGAAP